MRPFALLLQSAGPRALACALTLAACGQVETAGKAEPPASPHDVESTDDQGSGATVGEQSGPSGRDDDAAGATPAPQALACGDRPPSAFATLCSGCHQLGPSADPRIPDLLALVLDEAGLIARVRKGGGGMPAFGEESVSDAALRELYAFLKARRDKPRPALALGSVKPLFAAAATVLPVSFTRDDGVLITRGAGRVRGRHELEESYGPFGPHYFEDRTFGFVIEDFTVKGESRIRVSYLPIARPEDKTNFRAFKIYGNGNVFYANTGMASDLALPSLRSAGREHNESYARDIAPFARVQMHEVTRNARTDKPLGAGDMFEFEFGVFIDAGDVSMGSRTAYYTDTFRYRVGSGGLTPESFDTSGQLGPTSRATQGGATSLAWAYAEPETYFSQMALNIQHEHVQQFVEGRRLFHTDFATGAHSEAGNPAFPEQAKKLGPLFVTTSCARCHPGNGGGRALSGTLDENSSLAFKLYGADEPLGNQLQLQEGSARLVESVASSVTLGDGSVVKLSRPRFEVKSSAGKTPRASARIARRLVGLGLLEAVSEQSLLAQADPEDCDGDGISGRAHLVRDPSDSLRVGRFGWRAEKVSIEHQVADALDADLGVQTRVVPGTKGEIELSDDDLARLSTYMRLLGVPAQRDASDPQVLRGEALFRSVGCASCHLPALSTSETHPDVELRAQSIRPFTDLLLHDLGPELGDDSGASGDALGAAAATASEWRTPPLWGIGLSRVVQGYVALLHDGRAASVLEAVLWHAGEASKVRERFVALKREEREALLRFVDSL